MRKFIKNQKALSPVVASIILIAVTVALSIVVLAWMGAIIFDMSSEKIEITKVDFPAPNIVRATINNTGDRSFRIIEAYIGDKKQSAYSPEITVNDQWVLNITFVWTPSYNYQITIRSQRDKYVSCEATAPSK